MTSTSVPLSVSTFRLTPLGRITGSVLSWFLYMLNFTLFVYSVTAVMAVGGSCASGNTPYVIAVQCPKNAEAFMPWCIFAALLALALALYLAQGFGTQLVMLAWPGLFCGLGALFLFAFFATADPAGLILGGMFELMGIIPLAIELRGSPQRVLIGSINMRGQRYYEGPRARRSLMAPGTPNPQGAVLATLRDWVLSLVIAVVAGGGGVIVAYLWFRTV